mmetsp:Transcript_125983/g.268807  ORF Transcript_125983/g.268807 Transcript_125983/m.268807 type:complete len:275 (-) Transcript_125983:922-1746(-)
MRCFTASSAAASKSAERPSPATARTSFTRSAPGKEPRSGVTTSAALRRSSALSSAGTAPFALATAKSKRTTSEVAQDLMPTAAALATALMPEDRLALFVEATANSKSLAGPSWARSDFDASVRMAPANASEAKPRSAMANTAPASAEAHAFADKACSRPVTSSRIAPAPPSVRNTSSCSSGVGSGWRLSSMSKAEVAKVVATSLQEDMPACFTRSRAELMSTSATIGEDMEANAESTCPDPGSFSTRERRVGSNKDLPAANWRKAISAQACCAA